MIGRSLLLRRNVDDEAEGATGPAGFNELLAIEELDRNLYRAVNDRNPERSHLYGGQVAAQALLATGLTVPEGRHPHSVHGYFLRPGMIERPILLHVERDRDGHSFSTRHVVAVQDGSVIFDMTASFHIDEEGGEHGPPLPDGVTPPEAMERSWYNRFFTTIDLCAFPTGLPPFSRIGMGSRLWTRIAEPLPDDRLLHACGVLYLSDLGTGFAAYELEGVPRGGPSLDHALWFQRPIRADEWILIDLVPVKTGGGRGLYTGTMHARDGRLGATLAQEILARPAPPT
jgi:acyl-CoA thioesterase-2